MLNYAMKKILTSKIQKWYTIGDETKKEKKIAKKLKERYKK